MRCLLASISGVALLFLNSTVAIAQNPPQQTQVPDATLVVSEAEVTKQSGKIVFIPKRDRLGFSHKIWYSINQLCVGGVSSSSYLQIDVPQGKYALTNSLSNAKEQELSCTETDHRYSRPLNIEIKQGETRYFRTKYAAMFSPIEYSLEEVRDEDQPLDGKTLAIADRATVDYFATLINKKTEVNSIAQAGKAEQRIDKTGWSTIEFLQDGAVSYEGPITNGVPDGIGKVTYSDGRVYEGLVTYPNTGKSKGKLTCNGGAVYEGEFDNLIQNGKGIYFKDVFRYEGEFFAGKFHGRGKANYKNGEIYDGEWVNGYRSGIGQLTIKSGGVFNGLFESDSPVEGTFSWGNGYVYKGNYKLWKPNGKGKLWFPNGDSYEGDFLNGHREGYGDYVVAASKTRYVGDFKSNKATGNGTLTKADGNYFIGEMLDDKPLNGVWRNREGKVIATVSSSDVKLNSQSTNTQDTSARNESLLSSFLEGLLIGVVGGVIDAKTAPKPVFVPPPQARPNITRVEGGGPAIAPGYQDAIAPPSNCFRKGDGSGC